MSKKKEYLILKFLKLHNSCNNNNSNPGFSYESLDLGNDGFMIHQQQYPHQLIKASSLPSKYDLTLF